MELNSLSVSDGTVEGVTSKPGSLDVRFKDWKENVWSIVFDEVIAFESLGAEGEELSQIKIECDGEYKAKVMALMPDESETSCKVYSFISAWSDLTVLKVLADKVTIIQPA